MSDYDDDRNRQYRYYDEDFDNEGGYGRNTDYYRGSQGRGRDFTRGAMYGRGSDFYRGQPGPGRYGQDYGDYGQGYRPGRYSQYRGPFGQPQSGRDWDYNRGTFTREFDRDWETDPGNYGRGMDFERGDPGRNWGSRNQPGWGMNQDWDYNRGFLNRGQNRGRYGYNRGMSQPDWDSDYDWDVDTDFMPYDYTITQFWLIPGPESGRGPQGYQRTDGRIMEDVCDRLMQHGQIDASDIEVSVNNREVTLNGSVDSRRTKRMAEDVAESVPGVTNVHNQLKARQAGKREERQGQMGSMGQSTIGQQGPGRGGQSDQSS